MQPDSQGECERMVKAHVARLAKIDIARSIALEKTSSPDNLIMSLGIDLLEADGLS